MSPRARRPSSRTSSAWCALEKISTEEALTNADSATNLGLLIGNSGIMPSATDRAKSQSTGRPGAPSFSEFKLSSEDADSRIG